MGHASERLRVEYDQVYQIRARCKESSAFPFISPTRSPPARSSNVRPRWSRSWSRTRSTPARHGSGQHRARRRRSCCASKTTATAWTPRTRGCDRAACHQQDRHVDDLGAIRDAGLPRRGAPEHRLGVALHAADARARRRRPAPRSRSTAAPSPRSVRSARPKAPASRSPTCSTTFRRAASSSNPTPQRPRRSRG